MTRRMKRRGKMKDETWFMEQLEKAIVKCGSVSMLASEKGVDVLRYI